MSIIIFIIVLAVLIFVHELGHFLVAKKFGIRVDEFGIGFPPRALTLFKKGETKYTLNWIPFGGFVKIFGETPDQESIDGPEKNRSFINKPRWVQALVLIAGVAFNMIFAWLLISVGFMIGLPTPADYDGLGQVKNPELSIVQVMPESPAKIAGLEVGDKILGASFGSEELPDPNPETFSEFISDKEEFTLSYKRGEEVFSAELKTDSEIMEGRQSIGIALDEIGILRLNPAFALWEGARTSVRLTGVIAIGLADFILDIFVGESDFSQVAGPVGIVGLVGSASDLGFVYLLSFVAIISIHLAVLNLIPFPALDGGRLLFVLIESIIRRPIPYKFANALNAIGFLLLILLMIVITYNDIVKLF